MLGCLRLYQVVFMKLVVEGLSGVIRRAVDLRIFRRLISVGRIPVVISHLQYADDILYIGEVLVENL
jgi:hypothetical protein